MFYDNFSNICRKRGTTAYAVTQEMGLSPSTASNWKKNGTIPKQEQLDQLADILGCEVADFFRPHCEYAVVSLSDNGVVGDVVTSINTSDRECRDGALSDDERELVNMYRKLSVIDRAKLMVTVDEMANGSNRA